MCAVIDIISMVLLIDYNMLYPTSAFVVMDPAEKVLGLGSLHERF